jgi:NAD(P)-dependent dehydrogenase (short-subunit alcohol dehydrogenase family)
MKYHSLLDKVVVITGASSGIGKLAVEEFIAQGAKVVLAARSEEEMNAHLNELDLDDNVAIAVKTDVSDWAQVKDLAKRACDHFGRIDVWVNNASISLYGPVELVTPDEIRRVVDVNLMGQIHGMKAALDVFKSQHYGNIINITSALGKSSTPLQAAYVATKHGIVGFSSALREELMERPYKDIDVSVIMPSSMDTPLFVHARSKMGRAPKPIPPVYDPALTVDAILDCAVNPKPEVVVGGGGKLLVWMYRVAPRLTDWYMARTGVKSQLTDIPEPVEGHDNMFEPMPGTSHIRGGLGTTSEHMSEYARKHPVRIAISIAVPTVLALGLLSRRFRFIR